MGHALILDTNMIFSRAIQSRLEELGFSSFDHEWNEEHAVAAADRRAPDLIVVGDNIETGSRLGAVKRITSGVDVPILMITSDHFRARAFEGPFLLHQIEEAILLPRAWVLPF